LLRQPLLKLLLLWRVEKRNSCKVVREAASGSLLRRSVQAEWECAPAETYGKVLEDTSQKCQVVVCMACMVPPEDMGMVEWECTVVLPLLLFQAGKRRAEGM
jgi:hypothetical protein